MSDTRALKLESIISGHSINDDDADWLRDALAARQQARVPEQVRRDLLTELMDHAFNDGRQGLDSPSAATREAEQRFRAAMLAAAEGGQATTVAHRLKDDDVQWIVNDIAELGVMINGQAFFLYKGHSLVYEDATHDETGEPMRYRPVFKREFGECAHPINYQDPTRIGTVSLNDSDEWRELPPAKPPVQGSEQ